MKKLLTLTMVFMMGILLCPGEVLAEETDGQDDGTISELYGGSEQLVCEFDAGTVDLTEEETKDDSSEEEPEEEVSE